MLQPKDEQYWQAVLLKTERMKAYAFKHEAIATQELVLLEQAAGPSSLPMPADDAECK